MRICFHGCSRTVEAAFLQQLARALVASRGDVEFIIGSPRMFDTLVSAVNPALITFLLRYDPHPPAPMPIGMNVKETFDCYALSGKILPPGTLSWEAHWALAQGIGQGLMIALADAIVVTAPDDPDARAFLHAALRNNRLMGGPLGGDRDAPAPPKHIALIGSDGLVFPASISNPGLQFFQDSPGSIGPICDFLLRPVSSQA